MKRFYMNDVLHALVMRSSELFILYFDMPASKIDATWIAISKLIQIRFEKVFTLVYIDLRVFTLILAGIQAFTFRSLLSFDL